MAAKSERVYQESLLISALQLNRRRLGDYFRRMHGESARRALESTFFIRVSDSFVQQTTYTIPANTRRSHCGVLMLGRHRRR